MSDEREDLAALLLAPGWHRVVAHAKERWAGEGYGRRMKEAITGSADPVSAVKSVDAASDAVNEILSWPIDRAKQLQQQHEHALERTTLRRGGV